MISRAALILAALLCSLPAAATRSAWINGAGIVSNAQRFISVMGAAAVSTTESPVACQAPADMVLVDMGVNLRTTPSAGTSRTMTIRKGASIAGMVDTAMSVTYAPGEVGVKHTADEGDPAIFVSAGEWLSFKSGVAGAPTNTFLDFSVLVDGKTLGESFLCGSVGVGITNQPDNMSLNGSSQVYCGGLATDCDTVVSTPGRFRKLRCCQTVAPGAGESCTYTFRDFGTDTALSLVIDGAVETCDEDLVNDPPVAAGNPVDLNVDCTAGAIAAGVVPTCSVAFDSDDNSSFLLPFSPRNTNLSTTATQYIRPWTAADIPGTTETSKQQLSPALQIKGMECRASGAPGAGTSIQVTVRDDAVDSATSCSINDSADTCGNATESVVALDSMLALKFVPVGPPAARRLACTETARIAGTVVAASEDE